MVLTDFLFHKRDINLMITKMMVLAKNPELATELGKNARNLVENNYSISKSIKGLEDILNR